MCKLYTKEEFNNAKSREKLSFLCKNCNQIFHIAKHYIKDNTKFCNLKCKGEYDQKTIHVNCDNCGIPLNKRPSDMKNYKLTKESGENKTHNHNFCSSSCSAKYSNAHKTKGTRISKLEKLLQEKLQNIYKEHDYFHFNRKDAINSELDIYIPSLKLAFELNGIFHYEAIYGNDKLNSIINNDSRKFQLCIEHNIDLCIIDTSKEKYFKEKNSLKYLTIICDIINRKNGGR